MTSLRKHIGINLILLYYLSFSSVANAQVYPVQASLNISPPYSTYLNDYITPGSTSLAFNAYLADLTRSSLDVRFQILIEGSGIEIKTKENYIGSRYTLYSGSPVQFFGDDLKEYFDLANLDMSGISRSQFERTGALPEGIYRFTIEVLAYDRGVKISNSASSTAWLILNDPPIINLPLDNEIVTASDPQTVRFQWTPRHKGSPNSSFSTEYELKVVEIWPENRNPNDAINTSNPIFETTTSNNYFIYGLAEPPLIPGKQYAYQIRAKALAGIDQLELFKNHGYSEVRSFTFGESCNPPKNVLQNQSSNTIINLDWEPSPTNTAFNVRFRENSKNAFWFEEFSYLHAVRLGRLKKGTDYQVVIQAVCGTLISEETESMIFSTSNNENEFVCENLDLNIDLNNKIPVWDLIPGDKIIAGDFEIIIDNVDKNFNRYSGTGIASFPLLNSVKAKVQFDEIRVNTDYRVFSGNITTIYNPNSTMMYDLGENSVDVTEVTDNVDIDTSQTFNDPVIDTVLDQPIAVDSVYINEDGNIVVINSGIETIEPPPADGETAQYTDSSGNLISVDSNGNMQTTTSGSTSLAGQISNPGSALEFEFGPLLVKVNEDKEPVQSGENCIYNELSANIELNIEDLDLEISKEFMIESALFSYTRNCSTGDIISASIKWDLSDGKDIGEIGGIGARVYHLDLEVDIERQIVGDIHFIAYLSEDKALSNLAILRAGLSGEFKFSFEKTAEGNLGSYDFRDIEGINLDLVKQDQLMASLENGRFNEDGVLAGRVKLIQEIEVGTLGLKTRFEKLDFYIQYKPGGTFIVDRGTARIIVSSIDIIKGSLKVDVEIQNNETTASIESEGLKAFGMQLSDINMKIDIDFDLNFTTLEGSLMANHPDFGVNLSVNEINISDGNLVTFNFNGEVNYSGLEVVIQEANYDNLLNALVLNAYIEIEKEGIFIAATIDDFTIDEDGNITWSGYNANYDGIKIFGPLTIAISGESGENSGTWRATTAKASLTIQPEGLGEPITITDATINYTKHKSKERYKDLEIIVDQVNIPAPPLGPLDIQLTDLALKLEFEENYLTGEEEDASKAKLSNDSYLQFSIGTKEDIQAGRLLVIAEGASGEVTYNFNGEGLNGLFSYQNVENLNLFIRHGDSDLASLTNASIADDGVLYGTLSALPGAEFNSGGFTAEVEEMIFEVEVPIEDNSSEARITSGRGKLSLGNIGQIEGSISLSFEMDEESNISTEIHNTSEITAFGMNLQEFDLKVDLTSELQIGRIEGQLEAQHPQFNAALLVSEFIIENGELITFNFEGEVLYKGFNLNLSRAIYENDILIIDGKVAIDVTGAAAWLEVEELTITSDGTVTIRGIEGELDKTPVYVAFSASMDETSFKGSFTGELSGLGLEGTIDIGVEDEQYNYAYLNLASKSNIPLGPSGLKLTKLGGEFGYNYALEYTNDEEPTGSPQEGNYVVGLTLGVADIAGMVEFEGNSVVQFGNGNFDMNLNGIISIPKENSIATGSINANYKLPDHTLDGSLGLEVSIPPESGSVLEGNLDMDYSMAGGTWSITSTDISTSLFTEIQFTGNIALNGSSENNTFSGMLSGNSAYDFTFNNEFEAFGAKLIAQLSAGFNFQGDIAFDESGAEGEVDLSLYANGELGIETAIGGYESLISLNSTSLAQLSFNKERAKVAGQMDVTVAFLGFEHEVDIEIEQTI